jgi:adhesin transport system outer membrane protein
VPVYFRSWPQARARRIACCLAIPLMGLALAGSASAETLGEAVARAVATNPRVETLAKDRLAVDQELEQARAFWRPQVDVVGRIGPEYTNSSNTRDDGHKNGRTLTRKEVSGTLNQLIYDFGATQGEIDRNKARVKGAAYRVAETSEFVALDTVEAYLEVLRHRTLVELARQNIGAHQRILGGVQQRAQGGGGTDADVSQVNARLELARTAEARAREELRSAEARYLQVTGSPPSSLVQPPAPLAAMPQFDALIETVKATNPTVVALRQDIDAIRGQLTSADAGYYPRFGVELGATRGDDIGGTKGRNDSASAMVVMRWNLYRGGADQAKIEEFRQRLLVAQSRVSEAERTAEREARISWAAKDGAAERAQTLRAAVGANERVVGIYRDQFRLGQRTLLDLLDSENELFVTRSSQVSAEYASLFAMYRLLATNGTLLKTLNVALPKEAAPTIR